MEENQNRPQQPQMGKVSLWHLHKYQLTLRFKGIVVLALQGKGSRIQDHCEEKQHWNLFKGHIKEDRCTKLGKERHGCFFEGLPPHTHQNIRHSWQTQGDIAQEGEDKWSFTYPNTGLSSPALTSRSCRRKMFFAQCGSWTENKGSRKENSSHIFSRKLPDRDGVSDYYKQLPGSMIYLPLTSRCVGQDKICSLTFLSYADQLVCHSLPSDKLVRYKRSRNSGTRQGM